MTENSIELTGLDGANPMGFLASIGLLALLEEQELRCRLTWLSGAVSHPLLHLEKPLDQVQLAERLIQSLEPWKSSPALGYGHAWNDVKLIPEEARKYLQASINHNDNGASERLATHLIAEGSLANKGDSKPNALHFTSGNQKILSIACELIENLSVEDMLEALIGPWQYTSGLKTLRWDTTNDRSYALSAFNPTDGRNNPNPTIPGAEWLALHGLSFFPVFNQASKAQTTGVDGTWGAQQFTWPLWKSPINAGAIRSLISQAAPSAWDKVPLRRRDPKTLDGNKHEQLLKQMGVSHIYSATIKRTDSGGYGLFAAPTQIWSN